MVDLDKHRCGSYQESTLDLRPPNEDKVRPAEGEGFEPPGTCIPKLFKSFAFGRSAIPPGDAGTAGAYQATEWTPTHPSR